MLIRSDLLEDNITKTIHEKKNHSYVWQISRAVKDRHVIRSRVQNAVFSRVIQRNLGALVRML